MICNPAPILAKAGNLGRVSPDSDTPLVIASKSEILAEELGAAVTRERKDCTGNERENDPFARPALTFLFLALPALWIGWLMYRYGVDVPWGDAWDSTLPLFEKRQSGTLAFSDFLAFHNEHRILFPRLLTFSLATLTHWNVRGELLVIWILACVCSLNLGRVAWTTGWRNSLSLPWLLLGTNILLFSPSQWENLLWGFQIGFFLPLATLTACLWIAPSLRRPFDFLTTMILCLISTFSIASGFVAWFLTAPLLLLWNRKTRAGGEKIWWLVWSLVGVASIYFYFRGYAHPGIHPSVLEALKHPFLAIKFMLAYLGTPFFGTAPNPSGLASVASSALVILLAVCLLYVWRWRRDHTLLAHSLPWVALAGSALASAFLTMLGRLGFGVFAATQSRYVSFAVMLPIGLLFLTSLVFGHWREHSKVGADTAATGRALLVLGAALSLLFVYGAIAALESWPRFQHARLSGKAELLLINVVNEPKDLARNVHRGDAALKARTNFLDRLGYFRPRLVRSDRIREIASRTDGETMGDFTELGKTIDGEFTASGWAILPESHRTADGVLLTYDNAQGDPIIFALAEVGYKRAEVSQQLNDKAYLRCGWMKSWKAGQIPASTPWIRAWTFDAENCRAFQIGATSMEPPKPAP